MAPGAAVWVAGAGVSRTSTARLPVFLRSPQPHEQPGWRTPFLDLPFRWIRSLLPGEIVVMAVVVVVVMIVRGMNGL